MLKKLRDWWHSTRYFTGWYVKPTLHLRFLNGQEAEVTPQTFSLVLDDAPRCDWQWWVKDGVLLNRYPLSALQEVVQVDTEVFPILYTQSPLNMIQHDWATFEEIHEKISQNFFKKG